MSAVNTQSYIRKTKPCTAFKKSVKYPGINLTKEAKGRLYKETYKPPKKEIEENPRGLKDLLCSWISRKNIVKMVILYKATYGFKLTP